MNIDLSGKRAVVCGSTQGIGRACAMGLAEAGAAVTLVARHAEALDQVRSELPSALGQVHGVVQADFSDWQAVRDRMNDWAASEGPAHILINNSGGPPAGTAIEAEPDAYVAAFSQHLLCNQTLAQSLVMGMKEEKYGRIINIISTSVITPIRNLGVSNTIRGAVGNWARTLAAELGPLGITVNNVLPGFTATARLQSLFEGRASRAGVLLDEIERGVLATIPVGRLGMPEELANVVTFLASPEAAYVNGVNLPVDGGRLAAQ
ncbi:MAG: SDR family oxidoreductase [Planctomycetota bacterium]